MSKKGRPPTRPSTLRDGFYIEVRNIGGGSGIKIWRRSEKEMLLAAEDYGRTKDVVILGEYKVGKPVEKSK